MRMVMALTRESLLSVAASVFDLVEFCRRSQLSHGPDADAVCAVVSDGAEQFGFLTCLAPGGDTKPDVILVPPLKIQEPWMPSQYLNLVNWIRRCHDQGAVVASIGTGVFLLAEAGLLGEFPVATHPSYSDGFAERYPHIRQRQEPLSRGERLIVSGDLPWHELVLHLLALHWDRKVARLAAETFVINWRERIGTPDPEEDMRVDRVIFRVQHWLSQHYHEQDVVGRCAAHAGLSKRSLNRRFKDATGTTPIDFVQRVRIKVSQDLLLFTKQRVEDISHSVGYENIASFRKLFCRRTGISPAEYRRHMATAASKSEALDLPDRAVRVTP